VTASCLCAQTKMYTADYWNYDPVFHPAGSEQREGVNYLSVCEPMFKPVPLGVPGPLSAARGDFHG
jgi:hypothetical protein